MKYVLLLFIKFFQFAVSPFLGKNCRFFPSCSVYAEEALVKHGALYGSWLILRRLFKCGPWHPGGADPVP